ncbi:golgin subfamily B member 1 isoform X2 [Sesamum indicum]|uniref:Golgin subfamily B member 1 isoform X2 n=1 Tax=Sesamum indicum TaxID=4182 RepID=A0A6I9TM17_SESIN|nr:golgin subfamily B member 1 isoform X2 [Sesamum indicum]
MDKSKNRTDLLAAGRKKLQQFRQKKDGKGSNSRSSGKAGKAGRDTTVGAAAEAEAESAVTQQHAADEERSTHDPNDTITLSESTCRVDPVASEATSASGALSAKSGVLEVALVAGAVEFPLEGSGVGETRSNQSASNGPDVHTGVPEQGVLSSLVREDVKYDEPGSSDSMALRESADSSASVPIYYSYELERQHGEEQVTDEVGSSSGDQIDKGMVTQLEIDGSLSSNDISETSGDHMRTDSGNTPAKKETLIATQPSKTDNASVTEIAVNDAEEAQKMHGHAVVTVPITDPGLVSTVNSTVTCQQREGISSGSSNEEKTEMLDVSGGHDGLHTESIQEASSGGAKKFSEFQDNDTAISLSCKQVDLSSVLDGGLIKLSQLADILQILDEDEFRFLFMSRESLLERFRDIDKRTVYASVANDSFERLKEQLYVTSFSKDVFHLQLSEEQKLIDEISAVNNLLIEVQGKNEIFAEEIVQSRYELQKVVAEKEELQKQLHFSKAEVEGFAAEVNELQSKLEMAQGEISRLSLELADCRHLVEVLQTENENLNGSFKTMTEEKNKLTEEKGIILLENEKMTEELADCKASVESLQNLLRDDRRRFEEENDSMVRENSKLLANLTEFKNTVEALEAENKNFNLNLTSLSEERMKLEEEKVLAADQIEKMSKELIDHKDLIVTLQNDISNLNVSLMSMTEERNKLEEEYKSIFSEYEKKSHELEDIKISEAGVQAECSKAVDDLKEATCRINHLTEENKILKADVEFDKSKMKEPDQKKLSSQFEEVANRGVETNISLLQKPKSDRTSLEQLKVDECNDSFGFIALKGNLEDAEIVMQKLEKEIENMHFQSTSLSRVDKVAAPAVSRLIHTFESKDHADSQDPGNPPSEYQTTEDSYTRTKMATENLRALLRKLLNDASNASEFFRVMQSKLITDAAGRDRNEYNSLREHSDQVEEANIELMVLYEAMKDNIRHAAAKEGELLSLCDFLQKQELVLKSENAQLRGKLDDFQSKISELQSQLDGISRDSGEMVASISNQVQTLLAEVADRESILEEEWNSVFAQVLRKVGVLDSTVKTFYTSSWVGRDSNLDVVGCVAASVDQASEVIEGLRGQLEAAQGNCQKISDKHDMALNTLQRLYVELSELVRTSGYCQDDMKHVLVDDRLLDLLHPNVFDSLLDQLKGLLGDRLRLETENKQLNAELITRAREMDELDEKCLKSDAFMKLVEKIEQSVRLEGIEMDADEPVSRLESLINQLVQKYEEANLSLSLSASLEMQLNDLHGQVEHLNSVLVEYENENLVLRQSLKTAEEDLIAKVQEKVAELEQSEQRVSSLREKLSIAVTKGKGLISQRDGLKQSLAETSKELEKCSQELLSKDARLRELETKLKVYSEAGERMEALDSELSYIRSSATALRESFLLKDSVLQRIEEILEDLELPEHFHSQDIIEKIDWLAKSVGGNSLPLGDWDRRGAVGGGSYTDAGFIGAEGLKEDIQANPDSGDDLRRRYEELQNKFYGLAEHNEMLEQSLRDRNNLVLRWEEILDRVLIPSQLRSMEPEDKIQWLQSTLSEAQNHCNSLQQKINNLENFCASLNADVEDSQRRTSELEAALHQAAIEKETLSKDLEILSQDNEEYSKKVVDFKIQNENLQHEASILRQKKLQLEEEKENLSKDLEILSQENEKNSKKAADFKVQNENLQYEASILHEKKLQLEEEKETLSKDLEILSQDNEENSKKAADFKIQNENLQYEVSILHEKKIQLEEDICRTEDAIRRLQQLVEDALQDSSTENVVISQEGFKYFEEMLKKLIENYKGLSSEKAVYIDPTDVHVSEKGELSQIVRDSEHVASLSKKLEDSMGELMLLKEEKDQCMLNNQSLLRDVEELEIKKKELQDLLNHEEQKSASLREKLNLAVTKGRSLVQQRDGMKQVIQELNAEVERLKSDAKVNEKAISEYEEQIKNLFTAQERVQVMESENTFLRDRLAETERCLQEKDGSWSSILHALDDIDIGLASNSGNPIEKLMEIGKYLHDLRSGMDSLAQESRKSKRAAELLLAELNEVQERNDGLQEELAKAVQQLSELSREKELAENDKFEALAHVEKLSYIHSEEKNRQLSEIMVLKSGVDNMREDLSAIERELADVLSKDLEVLHNVKTMIKSFLESGGSPDLSALFPSSFPGGFMSRASENKVFMTEIGSLREQLHNHSHLLQEEASWLSEVVMNVHREYTSHKESCESMKKDVKKLELIEKEKESEIHILRGNISLLHESCASAISEIENWKEHVVGNALASSSPEGNLKSQVRIEGGNSFTDNIHIFNEELVRGTGDKLLLVVRDLISMQSELLEVGQREMKSTILNLQKELQEKDIQRDRICMELVNQIKEAETNAKNYLNDLQKARAQLHDSQRDLDVMKEEGKVLEQRMKELQDQEINSKELQQKVDSLTDALAAKVQETEALMQALDAEEAEMEDLANKVGVLENELQQKNKDLESLEASRAKALKKLSVTVSKFDELHYLSESLLSEVEKLQSQLQERDGEISFLRQEVTRCTNDALAVTEKSKKRSSDEIHDLFSWLDTLISRVQVHDIASDDPKSHPVNEYKEVLQKKILDLISELENLRGVAKNSDMLLQEERSKVEEMAQKEQYLKNSLREKESQLVMLQGAGDSTEAIKSTSEIMEVEPMTNKWAVPGTIAPQVRSLRKTNNDQVAIAIDMDDSNDRMEDDDDDKAHGFKSLTTSKIVPRFTRPVSDMVDGLWVSCDRALMRQPALRLGVIIYWAVLHALLATFVV